MPRKTKPRAFKPKVSGISTREFARELPGSRNVTFKKGAFIFKEGSTAKSCCLVVKGKLQIVKKTRGGPLAIATVREGEIIGEMAMLSGEKRSASVVAVTPVELIVIDHAEFVALLRAQHPFAGRLALQLSCLLATRCSRLLKLIARQPQVAMARTKVAPLDVERVLNRVYTLWAV